MKVAIIQEWLVTVGGSDKVVKAIADVFPNADIFTLVAKKEVCDELGIDWKKYIHLLFKRCLWGQEASGLSSIVSFCNRTI